MKKKRYKKYKLPFTQGRNIGLAKRKKYRAIHFQIMMLLEKYKTDAGPIEINANNYKELFADVEKLPEFNEVEDEEKKDYLVHKAIEFTIWKLFVSGNVTVGNILKSEVLSRHVNLIEGAEEAQDYKSALTGNRDLMEALNLVKQKVHSFEDNSMFGLKLSQKKDGTKDVLMLGTGAECISAIRAALRPQAEIKVIEGE